MDFRKNINKTSISSGSSSFACNKPYIISILNTIIECLGCGNCARIEQYLQIKLSVLTAKYCTIYDILYMKGFLGPKLFYVPSLKNVLHTLKN